MGKTIIEFLKYLFQFAAPFVPSIVANMLSKGKAKDNFHGNVSDAVGDADKLVETGEQMKKEKELANAEYEKRGIK